MADPLAPSLSSTRNLQNSIYQEGMDKDLSSTNLGIYLGLARDMNETRKTFREENNLGSGIDNFSAELDKEETVGQEYMSGPHTPGSTPKLDGVLSVTQRILVDFEEAVAKVNNTGTGLKAMKSLIDANKKYAVELSERSKLAKAERSRSKKSAMETYSLLLSLHKYGADALSRQTIHAGAATIMATISNTFSKENTDDFLIFLVNTPKQDDAGVDRKAKTTKLQTAQDKLKGQATSTNQGEMDEAHECSKFFTHVSMFLRELVSKDKFEWETLFDSVQPYHPSSTNFRNHPNYRLNVRVPSYWGTNKQSLLVMSYARLVWEERYRPMADLLDKKNEYMLKIISIAAALNICRFGYEAKNLETQLHSIYSDVAAIIKPRGYSPSQWSKLQQFLSDPTRGGGPEVAGLSSELTAVQQEVAILLKLTNYANYAMLQEEGYDEFLSRVIVKACAFRDRLKEMSFGNSSGQGVGKRGAVGKPSFKFEKNDDSADLISGLQSKIKIIKNSATNLSSIAVNCGILTTPTFVIPCISPVYLLGYHHGVHAKLFKGITDAKDLNPQTLTRVHEEFGSNLLRTIDQESLTQGSKRGIYTESDASSITRYGGRIESMIEESYKILTNLEVRSMLEVAPPPQSNYHLATLYTVAKDYNLFDTISFENKTNNSEELSALERRINAKKNKLKEFKPTFSLHDA